MNKNLRKPVIAGNWKMNKNRQECTALIGELKPLVANATCDVVLCVPYTNLETALEQSKNSNLKIAAQNCHWEKSGAFTGEISADMLHEMGVTHVVLGHSERRQYFGESDGTVNLRAKAALRAGLIPIICIGELLEHRELNITNEVVGVQTKVALSELSKEDMKRVILAYEPVWAIGTGKTATSSQANEVCKEIRSIVANLYDQATADGVVIQYGGSMNAANANELLNEPDVDGGLIGGASLKAQDFASIITAASK